MASRRAVAKSRQPTAAVGLSRDEVLTAALGFIDEHGLAGFSMRSLAADLGVYPTAVYWHTGNRETLLASVVGLAMSEMSLGPPSQGWERWLRGFAREARKAVHRHPNLAPIVGQLVWNAAPDFDLVEGLLAALTRAGFSGAGLINAYNAVVGSVFGYLGAELAMAPETDRAEWVEATRESWEQIPEDYPHLIENRRRLLNRAFVARWENGAVHPLTGGFDFMVDSLIQGIRARQIAASETD